jgi:hypothetical protein
VNTDAQALRKTAVGQTIRSVVVSPKVWALGLTRKSVAMRLKKTVKPCVLHWKVQTWSLSQQVWAAVPVPARHLSLLKWLKI